MLRATEHGAVSGNTLRNPAAIYGIVVANEPSWPEGPMPVGKLVIESNSIEHASVAGISVLGFGLEGPAPTQLGTYSIASNTIRNVRGAAIHLGNVGYAVVRGNHVEDCAMSMAADRWDRLDTNIQP